MGSPETEVGRGFGEDVHLAEVEPFLLHEFPVTNEQFELYDPDHSNFRDTYSRSSKQPALYVSFWEATCFALWTGNRLPMEVEWEYACRAGTTSPFHFGTKLNGIQANCNGKFPYGTTKKGPYRGRTTPKGKYQREYECNAWGLFDMHGNVWEWCDSVYSAGAPARVLRGGGWLSHGAGCRSAARFKDDPIFQDDPYGFRLAASLE